MEIAGKAHILFCLLFDQNIQVSADILTESIKKTDIFAYFCSLFLHEGALELMVLLEAIPYAKMYLLIVHFSTTFADGFAFLTPAEVTQSTLADTWCWKMILLTVSPFLHVLTNHIQPLLEKSQHCFLPSMRMQAFDDVSQQALGLRC